MEQLEQRLRALEGSTRRWRAVTLVLAAVVVSGVTLAQTSNDVADVLRCKKLEILDEDGKTRIMLTMHVDGPTLSLHDDGGKPRVGLAASEHESGIILTSRQGKRRLAVTVVENESGMLLYDGEGKVRVGLVVSEDQTGLSLNDDQGETRVGLNIIQDGSQLHLSDEKGTRRVFLGAGFPTGRDSRKTVSSESVIRLAGPNGHVIWAAP